MIVQYLHSHDFKLIQVPKVFYILKTMNMTGMDGETVLSKIRETSEIPIIVLTAKDSLNSKVEILGAGADDYLCKPFELEELLARIHVQLRKKNKTSSNSSTFKKLVLNSEKFDASIDETP